MKIIIFLFAALSMPLLASCVQERGCLLRVANQDHDSSSSQKIHADMDEVIHSRPVDRARGVNAELVVRNKKRRSFLRRSHTSPILANPQPSSFRTLVSAVMNRSISACVL